MAVGCTCTSKRAGKYWRLACRFEGKQKTLALGAYPAITLAQARRGRDDARALLAQGIDPSQNKQRLKEDKAVAALNTVEAMYRAYLANKRPGWSTTHYDREARSLEKDLYPFLGQRVIGEVEPTELLKACERVRDRDAVESAHRLLTTASGVWQYAIARGCATRDIAQDIKKALKPRHKGHFPAITDPGKLGELLDATHRIQNTSNFSHRACQVKANAMLNAAPAKVMNHTSTAIEA